MISDRDFFSSFLSDNTLLWTNTKAKMNSLTFKRRDIQGSDKVTLEGNCEHQSRSLGTDCSLFSIIRQGQSGSNRKI